MCVFAESVEMLSHPTINVLSFQLFVWSWEIIIGGGSLLQKSKVMHSYVSMDGELTGNHWGLESSFPFSQVNFTWYM